MSSETSDNATTENADPNQNQSAPPYTTIVEKVVEKIRNEPFLFLIAIVALLIGLFFIATSTGSADLRFSVIVLALLAFAGLLGYYVLAVLQEQNKLQRERWKIEQQRQRDSQNQATTAQPPTTNTFNTNASGATGVAIGPNATVNQTIRSPQLPQPNNTSKPDPPITAEQRTGLEDLLVQHQRNLTRLQAKKAVYARGEEPLDLTNQIEHEEQEIQKLQRQLQQMS